MDIVPGFSGTADNTAIALALVANERGYRCVVVIPETGDLEFL